MEKSSDSSIRTMEYSQGDDIPVPIGGIFQCYNQQQAE
jgi:hypothetical protein